MGAPPTTTASGGCVRSSSVRGKSSPRDSPRARGQTKSVMTIRGGPGRGEPGRQLLSRSPRSFELGARFQVASRVRRDGRLGPVKGRTDHSARIGTEASCSRTRVLRNGGAGERRDARWRSRRGQGGGRRPGDEGTDVTVPNGGELFREEPILRSFVTRYAPFGQGKAAQLPIEVAPVCGGVSCLGRGEHSQLRDCCVLLAAHRRPRRRGIARATPVNPSRPMTTALRGCSTAHTASPATQALKKMLSQPRTSSRPARSSRPAAVSQLKATTHAAGRCPAETGAGVELPVAIAPEVYAEPSRDT